MKIIATTAMGKKIVAVYKDGMVDAFQVSRAALSFGGGNKNSKETMHRSDEHVLEIPDSLVHQGIETATRAFCNINCTRNHSDTGYFSGNCLSEADLTTLTNKAVEVFEVKDPTQRRKINLKQHGFLCV